MRAQHHDSNPASASGQPARPGRVTPAGPARSVRGRVIFAALLVAAIAAALLGAGRPGAERVQPPLDSDGDGIHDASDACPGAPGLAPEGCPPRDSDGDGVLDRSDACVDQAGPIESRGCPDRDSDGDGVVDRADRCPAERGHGDAGGCAPPDRDGDAVWDQDDACPDRAEVWNGRSDRDGCPDTGRALIEVDAGRHPAVLALASGRWFRRSGRLSAAGRDAAGVAAAALAAARARRVRVEVTAPVTAPRAASGAASGGRSSGAAPVQARGQAEALARELVRRRPGLQVELAPVVEGEPRVRLVFE